jgi:hypothetical protein
MQSILVFNTPVDPLQERWPDAISNPEWKGGALIQGDGVLGGNQLSVQVFMENTQQPWYLMCAWCLPLNRVGVEGITFMHTRDQHFACRKIA